MNESIKSKITRTFFNFFPAYRRTGARIIYISNDLHEIKIELKLNWKTRNYAGTIFGGSMFGAIDPIYMVALIKALGDNYIAWDKRASIEFKKPATCTLFADFKLNKEFIEEIKTDLSKKKMIKRSFLIDLYGNDGYIYASMSKDVYLMKQGRNKQKHVNNIFSFFKPGAS